MRIDSRNSDLGGGGPAGYLYRVITIDDNNDLLEECATAGTKAVGIKPSAVGSAMAAVGIRRKDMGDVRMDRRL